MYEPWQRAQMTRAKNVQLFCLRGPGQHTFMLTEAADVERALLPAAFDLDLDLGVNEEQKQDQHQPQKQPAGMPAPHCESLGGLLAAQTLHYSFNHV